MEQMRVSYRQNLGAVVDDVVVLTNMVRVAVQRANKALLEADLSAAEGVITGDPQIDAMSEDLDTRCLNLIATEGPVAGELRTLVATIRMVGDLARMGDLAVHVAKIARMRYPEQAVPASIRPNFERLCRIAEDMTGMATAMLEKRSVSAAESMAQYDEEADELRSQQFDVILSDEWADGVQAAVDVALLGRYVERIADHAVLIASRVVFIVTGLLPEGDHWTTA